MIVPEKRFALTLLPFVFSFSALADLSQTTALPASSAPSLDTGAVSAAGAAGTPDILWNTSGITPPGNATAMNVGVGADSSVPSARLLTHAA